MLSDSPVLKNVKSPKYRSSAVVNKKKYYSDNQKIEAVKCWLITGNLMQVAAATTVDYNTLKKWKASNWWKESVEELKTENSIQLSARLRKLTNLALEQTEDRLVNGEWFYDQITGELRRKPVTLRDVERVASNFIANQVKIDKIPDEKENNQQVLDRLEALKATFEQFAGKKKAIQVTDVVFVEEKSNALHEKREEGLPEGESLGPSAQGWEAAEGSSSEEQGETDADGVR